MLEALIVIGVVLLLVIALIAVRKERLRAGGGSIGNALQEFHAAFDPGVKQAMIERQADHVQESGAGEPPLED